MLDLKAKLASAGLVTEEDIARVETKRGKKARSRRKGKSGGPNRGSAQTRAGVRPLDVTRLQGVSKNELYDAVRRWIDQARLDARGVPSESSQAFHFPETSGRIGRLMLEPALANQIQRGQAAVVAYMSNSGLAHAVVPADGARNLASLRPQWLRVLASDPRAGAIIKD